MLGEYVIEAISLTNEKKYIKKHVKNFVGTGPK